MPDSVPATCQVCLAGHMLPFDMIRDLDGNDVKITECSTCGGLTNTDAYERLKTTKVEDAQLTDFYVDKQTAEPSVISQQITDSGAMLDVLQQFDGRDRSQLHFLDFGAGAGIVALAATDRYRRSTACEWDLRAMDSVLKAAPAYRSRVVQTRDISQIKEPADVVLMWHVLEHLPRPTEFWRTKAHLLRSNAVFFIQVPLYRPAHIVHCHYTFFTERSLAAWAAGLACDVVHIGYDTNLGFISLIARRQA